MTQSLLSFGAKNVAPEILEKTLTVRKIVVDEIEAKIIDKANKNSTYQTIMIAPRGSGKTHLTKVIYDRLKSNKIISNKIIIAYMPEDPVGIANFTHLLISIIRSFIKYNEPKSEILNELVIKASKIGDLIERENYLKDVINQFVGKRIVIVLIENFNKVLANFKKTGQQKLRDFIHQYNNLSIIATSQSLIKDIQKDDYPFYNFFDIYQLKKLNYDEAANLLKAIATIEKNTKLLEVMDEAFFIGKLKAIYALTEGNHRLLVTFYSFLNAEYKAELSKVFVKVMNNLKPYYEQFVNHLAPEEQRIVEYLSQNRNAIDGKTIATDCFLEKNTSSKQLSNLYQKGMIDRYKSGGTTFYELKEPLLRISFEIGENPNGISKLFIDFLSTFYEQQTIKNKYIEFHYGCHFQHGELKEIYQMEAMMYKEALPPIVLKDITKFDKELKQVKGAEELKKIIEKMGIEATKTLESKFLIDGLEYANKNQYKEAIDCYKKVIEINPKNDATYYNMGFAYGKLDKHKKAIECFNHAIKINLNYNNAYYNMGVAYHELLLYKETIECYKKAVEINSKDEEAYYNMGVVYYELQKYKKTIECYKKTVAINPKNDFAYNNMGTAYGELHQYKEAIECLKKAIEINPNNDYAYINMGNAYRKLHHYKRAIEYYKKAVEINPKNDFAYNNMGITYLKIKKIDKSILAFKNGIKLNPNNFHTKGSLLRAYISANNLIASKKLFAELIKKADNKLLSSILEDDILYYLFRDATHNFSINFCAYLVENLITQNKEQLLWRVLPNALFNVLINIENYSKEILQHIKEMLETHLAKNLEITIPLKLYTVGVEYLKGEEKNALFKLSKEERELFKKQILDKRL